MGRVAAPHGVRGAVKVRPESADPAALSEYAQWWLRSKAGAWTPYRVREVREHSGMLVAQLAEVESREQAALLRGAETLRCGWVAARTFGRSCQSQEAALRGYGCLGDAYRMHALGL